MKLESLIGKSSMEVVLSLPKFKWNFEKKYARLLKLFFKLYEMKKPMEPKKEEDLFFSIATENLSLQKIKGKYSYDKKRKIAGICSLVEFRSPELGYGFGHIPMIDMDTRNPYLEKFKEKELIELIKKRIDYLNIERGVILSSSERNYHFIGIGKILDYEELINFLGSCLINMRYKDSKGNIIELSHPAHIGHSLNPSVNIENENLNFPVIKRVITLRINPKIEGSSPPIVIDIYEKNKNISGDKK